MLFTKEIRNKYSKEINNLQQEHLSEIPKAVTYFGEIENSELIAIGAVKCYSGSWHLRSCVVKPEHRGKGLQRKITREMIQYLVPKTNKVKVSIYPENEYSIRNALAEGFVFEKIKKLDDGKFLQIYQKKI